MTHKTECDCLGCTVEKKTITFQTLYGVDPEGFVFGPQEYFETLEIMRKQMGRLSLPPNTKLVMSGLPVYLGQVPGVSIVAPINLLPRLVQECGVTPVNVVPLKNEETGDKT